MKRGRGKWREKRSGEGGEKRGEKENRPDSARDGQVTSSYLPIQGRMDDPVGANEVVNSDKPMRLLT